MGNPPTIILAMVLAFFFGYSLTMPPLLRSDERLGVILTLAIASDTLSTTVMEIVGNLTMLIIPSATEVGLGDFLFWGPWR